MNLICLVYLAKQYGLRGVVAFMHIFPGRESKKNGVVLNKYSILVFRRILYTLYSLSMSPVVFSLKLLYKIPY